MTRKQRFHRKQQSQTCDGTIFWVFLLTLYGWLKNNLCNSKYGLFFEFKKMIKRVIVNQQVEIKESSILFTSQVHHNKRTHNILRRWC